MKKKQNEDHKRFTGVYSKAELQNTQVLSPKQKDIKLRQSFDMMRKVKLPL